MFLAARVSQDSQQVVLGYAIYKKKKNKHINILVYV